MRFFKLTLGVAAVVFGIALLLGSAWEVPDPGSITGTGNSCGYCKPYNSSGAYDTVNCDSYWNFNRERTECRCEGSYYIIQADKKCDKTNPEIDCDDYVTTGKTRVYPPDPYSECNLYHTLPPCGDHECTMPSTWFEDYGSLNWCAHVVP
jgi:hypothetical protein